MVGACIALAGAASWDVLLLDDWHPISTTAATIKDRNNFFMWEDEWLYVKSKVHDITIFNKVFFTLNS